MNLYSPRARIENLGGVKAPGFDDGKRDSINQYNPLCDRSNRGSCASLNSQFGPVGSITLIFLVLILVFPTLACESKRNKQESQTVKAYLLPEHHPLQMPLSQLFKNKKIFSSANDFEREGFKVLLGHHNLMIGSHPFIQGYVVKKFTDKVSNKDQLQNYIKRIEGAKKIRKIIQSHQFKYLKVPEKWLYRLGEPYNKKAYVLIAEDMDTYNWDDPDGQLKQLYYNIDIEALTELCVVLHLVGGCDAYPRNQPFTRSGKIAFVDTEHVGKEKLRGYFIKQIVPAVREELREYAIKLWNTLEQGNK